MRHYLKNIRGLGLVLLVLATTSCSSIFGGHGVIQDRGKDYLSAKSIPPLRIPPGLSSSTIQAEYPVSDGYYPGSDKEVSLVPPALNS